MIHILKNVFMHVKLIKNYINTNSLKIEKKLF